MFLICLVLIVLLVFFVGGRNFVVCHFSLLIIPGLCYLDTTD